MKIFSILLALIVANAETLPEPPPGPPDLVPLIPPNDPPPLPPTDPADPPLGPVPEPLPPKDPQNDPPPGPPEDPPKDTPPGPPEDPLAGDAKGTTPVTKCKKKTNRRILSSETNGNQRQAIRNSKLHGGRSSEITNENDFEYFYFYAHGDGRLLNDPPVPPADPLNDPPVPPTGPLDDPPVPPTGPLDDPQLNGPVTPVAKANANSPKAKKKGKSGKTAGSTPDADGWCPDNPPTPSKPTTPAPTKKNHKPCKALDEGNPLTTTLKVEVMFRYNLVRKTTQASADKINSVSNFIQKALAGGLLGCDSSSAFVTGNVRTLLQSNSHIVGIGPGRIHSPNGDLNHRSLQIASFKQPGPGTANLNVACSTAVPGLATAGTNCDVVDDSITVYMVPDSPESSATSATDDTLSLLRNLMNNQASAIMASDNGIQGLLFIGQPGNSTGGFVPPSRVQGSSNTSQSLSGAGMGLIIGSVILLLLIAFVAVRRRRVTQYRTKTSYEEDEMSLFSKSMGLYSKNPHGDTDTEAMSTTSSNWRRARNAHVLGEGDSVSPLGASGSIIDDLRDADSRSLYGSPIRSRGLEDDLLSRDSNDVHRCQSATCEICSQRRVPLFIPPDCPEGYLSIRSPAERTYHSSDTVHL